VTASHTGKRILDGPQPTWTGKKALPLALLPLFCVRRGYVTQLIVGIQKEMPKLIILARALVVERSLLPSYEWLQARGGV
jgi:hypothetical protein